MLERREVYADLMRSSGVELDFEESRRVKLYKSAPFGERFTHATRMNSADFRIRRSDERFHAGAMNGVAANWEINFAGGIIEAAFHQSDIGLFDGAGTERFGQLRVSKVILGNDNEAGGFFV